MSVDKKHSGRTPPAPTFNASTNKRVPKITEI